MKRYLYITAIFSLLFAASCKKELKVTPYQLTTNEVTLSLNAESYTVVVGDTLKVAPGIVESKPEGHTFTYSWQVWPNTGDGPLQEISKEKNINAKILLIPGSYRLRYVVKDEVTGISYLSKAIFLSVQTTYNEGWLVTHNSGGKGNLGFIRRDDVVFLTPLEDVNEKSYDEGISASFSNETFNPFQQIIFITKSGAYRLDAKSLVEMADNSKLFFNGAGIQYSPDAYHSADARFVDQVIINNGDVYSASASDFFNGANGTEKFTPRLPGDYFAFPYMFRFGPRAFYDNKNKRFMSISSSLEVAEFSTGFSNAGRKMVAADIGPANEVFCVMRDENTGKFYLFSVSSAGSHTKDVNKNQEMLNCPDLSTATAFTTSTKNVTLYYASGNKVYLYDPSPAVNAAKLIYTFPAGYTIKDIRMFKGNGSNPDHNNRLVVGVNNGTSGEVYYLGLNSLGQVQDNTYTHKFAGFGQIVHLNYRTP